MHTQALGYTTVLGVGECQKTISGGVANGGSILATGASTLRNTITVTTLAYSDPVCTTIAGSPQYTTLTTGCTYDSSSGLYAYSTGYSTLC